MKQLLNTLYIDTHNCRLSLENGAVMVTRPDGETIRTLGSAIDSVICFGPATITTPLIRFCAENGITISYLSEYGRFYGRVVGETHGNVNLRMEQYRQVLENTRLRRLTVRQILSVKLWNSAVVLRHAARDAAAPAARETLSHAADEIGTLRGRLEETEDSDLMRGIEGHAANLYFAAIPAMIRATDPAFRFEGRNRRPPRDAVNALLSLFYTILAEMTKGALECVGLDPACGLMHSIRPGRASLALDLMEELRAPLCDRFVISLINLRQVTPADFERRADGAVFLTRGARRNVLQAWQRKKQEMIYHPGPGERVPLGLLPWCQARSLARTLQGKADAYVGCRWR